MPYRIDIFHPPDDALDRLVQLGAIDVEQLPSGIAALLPDTVAPEDVKRKLGLMDVTPLPIVGRDNESVWLLSWPELRIGKVRITAAGSEASGDAVQLMDSSAFGSGCHPTTAVCLELLDELLAVEPVASILDVGTGSGILALAAMRLGVRRAVGLDIDPAALDVARRNAILNGVAERFQVVEGGPDAVQGQWPLVVANVLAAPLIEMAPLLVRRIASRGRLILSGIQTSLAVDVLQPYRNLGMHSLDTRERAGWTAMTLRASW